MRIVSNGEHIPIESTDSVLIAQLRAGQFPPGSLCLTGDCGNCLATVDGVPYVRTCQTPAEPGLVIESHAADHAPELPSRRTGPRYTSRHEHRRLVKIGENGADDDEVVGIYPGPQVVLRRRSQLLTIDADRVVVAAGRMDVHPVCEGNRLAGILTPAAAIRLAGASVDLGDIVSVGEPVEGFGTTHVAGDLVRFEGRGRVEAVVVVESDGMERVHPCDTVIVGSGTVPRDILARMGGTEVKMKGTVSDDTNTLPPPPVVGVVCPCSNVTVADLNSVADRGFEELELIKRATLAGTGTCQGAACLPHMRAFVRDRMGGQPPAPFTARPLAKQITMAEAAAGWFPPPFRRTTLHDRHIQAGAVMDRFGGWWRPWHYGSVESEYWAVREAVSIGDVSTLGKVIVSGPDVESFLDRIYPSPVSGISHGRSKYVLMLDEAGYVIDDGLVCRDEDRFYLTFTTGGASTAEAWLRDWAETWDADVRILDRSASLGAINVTGPLATELLAQVGLDDPLGFMHHTRATIAGVPCRVFRLSFTGEISYELHHPIDLSPDLWDALMAAGAPLGLKPHGIDALFTLRLEKGHVLIGMDTEPDSTPRRLGMEWAVRSDARGFIGSEALLRTDAIALDRKLVGMTMDGPAPPEGTILRHGREVVGHVTSSRFSPTLGHTVMLGWVRVSNQIPDVVEINDDEAVVVDVPFFDPSGARPRG